MFFYTLKRLFLILPTLLCVLLVNFLLLKLLPGSPLDHLTARVYGGTSHSAEVTNFNAGGTTYGDYIPESYAQKQVTVSEESNVQQFLTIRHYMSLDFGKSYFGT